MILEPTLEPDDVFRRLCAIPSASLDEHRVGSFVLDLLADLALEAEVDGAGQAIGGNQGNIIVRIGGAASESGPRLLFAAHLDTVPPGEAPDPVLEDGVWRNSASGILGADNKAAVAALLCAAARWANERPAVPLALVFTVAEECGLKGAAALDLASLGADAAFVFDHPTPIGTVVTGSPTLTSIVAEFSGRASHAGVDPESGASAVRAAALAIAAMPQGRISEGATANVGLVSGGSAANVTAASCRLEAELRAVDQEEHDALLLGIGDSIQAAAAEAGCSADVTFERAFNGYAHAGGHRAVAIAEAALETLGIEPVPVVSGGGSDANVFEAAGIPAVNLGDGSLDTHTDAERISSEDLARLLSLVLALPASVA